MAAREGKFGTFGGVYTPSLMTILGVIMYLRLPWVVGNAGLYAALGIIAVAHVISVCTGLSISSIATDKSVGAGGAYYIVSRSLGLPIGGTLGLALFVGLSFSISLYIIGFSESLLGVLGIEATLDAVRLCGTITIVALTVITFISTALAVKSQYLILTAVGVSLLSVFAGTPERVAAAPHLAPLEGGAALPVLFAIFFPAVTGFTTGVNMSGDLENPKKSIPSGTMLSIFTGMAIYTAIAVYLALRVPAEQLVDDPNVLLNVALVPEFVIAGIWGATLSSALGSILGAPRILQAAAADGITTRFLARGYGKTHEPRNALILAFVIGEAGILIGQLDTIARIVTMVFLTTYGFLNISCAIESWASPDFRPAFRIPTSVSVLGAVTCVVIMIQLDLLAMLGAALLMASLFAYLKRRELRLESGDAWEGIWSSLVRAGLFRLNQLTRQHRNWRPNVLAFGAAEGPSDIGSIGLSLLGGTGMLTEIRLVESRHRRSGPTAPGAELARHDPPPLGVFRRCVVAADPFTAIPSICEYHGISGLEPNTVLFDFGTYGAPDRLARLLAELTEHDLNQLVVHENASPEGPKAERIDVWWRPGAGNLSLTLSLVRFVTASQRYERATVRFVLLCDDAASKDSLRSTARRHLAEQRIEAEVRVLHDPLETRRLEDWVRQESGDAALVLIGLPNQPSSDDEPFLRMMHDLLPSLGGVLMFRASSSFAEVLAGGRAATPSMSPPAGPDGGDPALPPLRLPQTPELEQAAREWVECYEALALDLDRHGLSRIYSANVELVRRMQAALAKNLSQLDKSLGRSNVRRRQQALNRAQSAFLLEAEQILSSFAEQDASDQRVVFEGRVEAFLQAEGAIGPLDAQLEVRRVKADFAASAQDSAALRRFKRRRRMLSWFRRGHVVYRVPVGRLRAQLSERMAHALLHENLVQSIADAHQLAVHLGKLLSSPASSFAAMAAELSSGASAEALGERRARAAAMFDELIARHKAKLRARRRRLREQTRELLQASIDELDRIDAALVAGKRRIPDDAKAHERSALSELPARFVTDQRQLLGRAGLAVKVSGFQHRLITLVRRQREEIATQLDSGALRDCLSIRDSLTAFLERLGSARESPVEPPRSHAEFAQGLQAKSLVDALLAETLEITSTLPESVRILTDEAIDRLERGQQEGVDVIDLSLRRLAQFLIETELVAVLQQQLEGVSDLERKALTIAHEVSRLVSFHWQDLETHGGDEPSDFALQLKPAVESGLERLNAEIERLQAVPAELERVVERQLRAIVEATSPYELTRASERLEQHIRLHQSKKAVSGAQGVVRRGVSALRGSMVSMLYRASAGVVLARTLRARAASPESSVDHLLSFVADHSPPSDVLKGLPFYYRQLFLGQSLNDAFWVGRESQMAQARRAVQRYRAGHSGVIMVTGQRGSGKTALCQRIAAKLLDRDRTYWVRPPAGGSCEPAELERALQRALQLEGTAGEIMRQWPEGCTIVIDDLELWWERRDGGLAALDFLWDLIDAHGRRCLFVLGVGKHALSLIGQFRPLTDTALTVLECDPLPAEALGSIIMLRHGSTGMQFSWRGRREAELSKWQLARLFSHHFNYARGCVGAALGSWLAHIDKVDARAIELRLPLGSRLGVLEALRVEQTALLVSLMLHKQLTSARLQATTLASRGELDRALAPLLRTGLVTQTQSGVLEVDRFVQHFVSDSLESRGLLP